MAWQVSILSTVLLAAGDEVPRPEHPNPQMQRAQWQNLNGKWDFWEGDECDEAAALGRQEFPDRIVVPFCRESKRSGLARTGFVKNVIYRREFAVPGDWGVCATAAGETNGRVLLHIGACDWRTVVWVNGKRVGIHEGGSAPITCEFTDALRAAAGSKNELRVWAFDDTRSKLQQCGKQSDKDESYGCVYTRTTGIWQTVWIERVGATFVRSLRVVPDRANLRASLVPECEGDARGVLISAAMAPSGEIATAWAGRGAALVFRMPEQCEWTPETPRLFALRVRLLDKDVTTTDHPEGRLLDEVTSYFGMRDVAVDGERVLLNGAPVFQRLILDQGFYPDGIWTAPTDDALKHDIEMCKAAGFNGARLHQKVFEPRFHYWADKLGYLTWGEAPSWGNDDGNPATHRIVLQEWAEIVERDRNHPSIVGWCPFNETGDGRSGPLQNAVTAITRAIDPTRLVLDTSGYAHSDPMRDVDDAHDYDQEPASFRARWWPSDLAAALPARYGDRAGRAPDRPFFVSEFGGIGWIVPGDKGWGYGGVPKTEEEWFTRFKGLCDAQLDNPSLFGFCYTQLTDVEQERNGLYFYDRRPKFDVAKLRAIVARKAAIETEAGSSENGPSAPDAVSHAPAPTDWQVVLPSAVDDPQRSWMYVEGDEKLAAASWRTWKLEQSLARAGRPGFGKKDGFPVVIGTPWTKRELYLFRLFEWDGAPFSRALLVAHHDEEVTICLNGEELFARKGWNDRYEPFDVTERAHALLKPGANELTVHVSQTGGGQYFDAALLVAPAAATPRSGGSPPR